MIHTLSAVVSCEDMSVARVVVLLTSTIFEATSSGSSDANSSFSHERSVELPQSALPESLTARSPTA